ncbi:MAG: DUF7064 domain-containing protein, partial [Acidimicrobiia bacterium]
MLAILSADTDLLVPRPGGGSWDPSTVHTHYFGFSVPEHGIGVFAYIRWQPVFGSASGGVCIFRGLGNREPLDVEHNNFVYTMPYPRLSGTTITTVNGLEVDFVRPGAEVRLRYGAPDGSAGFDVTQRALSPLVARGHVVPGEDANAVPGQRPGGTEQFMHCTGTLRLGPDRYGVDGATIRDRSWRQVRSEAEMPSPPVGWSPMYFGPDLMFNQVGFEPAETDPAWKGLYDVAAGAPSHHFGWVCSDDGLPRHLTEVRRSVASYHPELFAATDQEIHAEDETGRRYRFRGRALAMARLPAWPNFSFTDSVYRWEDDDGRIA